MNEQQMEEIRKAYEEVEEGNMLMEEVWLKHVVFTGEWWLALGLAIVPWVLWIIFRKKESTDRLLYVGIFIVCISSWLDFLGVIKGLWVYHIDVIFTIPPYLIWDFSVLPVTVMFLLQVKPQVHPLWKALLFAGGAAFVGETILKWAEFYEPLKWSSFYSFPIYIVIYLMAHYISRRDRFAPLG